MQTDLLWTFPKNLSRNDPVDPLSPPVLVGDELGSSRLKLLDGYVVRPKPVLLIYIHLN